MFKVLFEQKLRLVVLLRPLSQQYLANNTVVWTFSDILRYICHVVQCYLSAGDSVDFY